jgi:predicted acylesterase/phospholipase RssA
MFAMGWDWETILDRTRRLWTQSGRLFDYTVPIVALVKGRKGQRLISDLFGDTCIEDVWTPYFCVSSNLTNATLGVHTRGLLWKAVVASASLPGILPPRFFSGELHCDGGVLDNLPVDTMRTLTRGPVLAVDVGLPKDVKVDPELYECPSGTALLWRMFNPFSRPIQIPNIMSIMARSAVLSSIRRTQVVQSTVDCYIRPNVGNFEIFDFSAIDELVECGYEAMTRQIEQWHERIAHVAPMT